MKTSAHTTTFLVAEKDDPLVMIRVQPEPKFVVYSQGG